MKNFLIVGASGGIGHALANRLIHNGHTVFGSTTGLSHREVPDGVQALEWRYPDQEFPIEHLPASLDGVAYLPGRIQIKPFSRIGLEDWLEDYRIQVLGAVRVLQLCLPRLQKSASASVLLFSTVAVQTGFPFHSLVSASKGAIEGLTRALAAEWAPAIRVNAIAPSLTDTPLAATLLNQEAKKEANAQRHPLKRLGKSEDMAALAAFLLTADSGWITGQIFPVDGGISSLRT